MARQTQTMSIVIVDILGGLRGFPGVSHALDRNVQRTPRQVDLELLAEQVETLGEGWRLVRREYPTAIGPVDLMCRDADGGAVAVEIKRRGEIDGVEQLARYIERLEMDSSLGDVRGVFVAQVVKPQARVLAESRGIRWVEVDYDELRGAETVAMRLF